MVHQECSKSKCKSCCLSQEISVTLWVRTEDVFRPSPAVDCLASLRPRSEITSDRSLSEKYSCVLDGFNRVKGWLPLINLTSVHLWYWLMITTKMTRVQVKGTQGFYMGTATYGCHTILQGKSIWDRRPSNKKGINLFFLPWLPREQLHFNRPGMPCINWHVAYPRTSEITAKNLYKIHRTQNTKEIKTARGRKHSNIKCGNADSTLVLEGRETPKIQSVPFLFISDRDSLIELSEERKKL